MSERRDIDFLRDIEESMGRIACYTRGMEHDGFFEDHKTQDTVIRNIAHEQVFNAVRRRKRHVRGIGFCFLRKPA